MATATEKPQHRSTMRVLDILETLANASGGLTMAEICREVGAPKGSLSPILHTMADTSYVAYDDATKRYSIGLKTYLLGKSFDRESTSMSLFMAAMRGVTNACGETCQLGVLDHGRVLYIAKVDSPQPVRLTSSIGKTLPIHYTAIGKVLVSEMGEADVRAMLHEPLERPTQATVRSADEFIAQLDKVRREGFAYDREEATEAVQCIGVGIRRHGVIEYGLSVTTPSYRMGEEKQLRIKEALVRAKRHMERALA
ncbi:IclR family transcriptional regulator [Parolsenella catena]|nr:IclR family transcriptional regulator [Parolsenella catena]